MPQAINYPKTAKSPTPSTGNAWASVAAAQGISYQLVSIAGGCSSHGGAVSVLFGGTEQLRWSVGGDRSGSAVSEQYGLDGPITAPNQSLVVRTTSQPGGQSCYSNFLYRIMLV